MNRRGVLAVAASLLGGCAASPGDGATTADERGTDTRETETAVDDTETGTKETETTTGTTVAPEGVADPAGGIAKVRRHEDSVTVYLDGYDSFEYADATFRRPEDASGTTTELSRAQVTSDLALQNAMAYFGPDVTEVSVRMPISDGDRLARALASFRDTDAVRTDDGFWAYRFGGLRFVAYVVRYG